MQHTREVSYHDGDVLLKGYLADDDTFRVKKPAVLVVHDWSGRNDFACNKAELLASLGYAGFALDMYGNGAIGQTNDEKMALMKPLMADRQLLLRRIRAAVEAVKTIEQVDTGRIAVIGFCFGGLCALDLARDSEDIRGAVSLHGLLLPPDSKSKPIQAKILVLHGHDDPMVPPEQVLAFEKEMTAAKADWQVLIFGGTKHGFTNPLANDPALGTLYSPTADKRAWIATKNFLGEILMP